jgi:hypothetical protein
MKMKLMLFLLLLGYVKMFSQNLVTNITITMPATVPANTNDWATAVPPIMITAKGSMLNGTLNGNVIESKMLVTIKRDGAKVCGMYTKSTAPNAGFTTAVKTWNGSEVVSMLGQECNLQPGNYELCVQFFRIAPIGEISAEVCKPFTVAGTANPTNPTVSTDKFTPPTNMAPVNGTTLKTEDAKKPLTFRWTPIIPKPQTPVTYKLRVWQQGNGQSSTQVIKGNTPVIEREIKNLTQFVKPNLLGDIELIDNKADLVWNVQAVNEQGAVMGSSEPTVFGVGGNTQARLKSQYQIETKNIAITCTNTFGLYNYTIVLKNPNASTAKFITLGVSSSIPSGATITSISPAIGTTIASGNQIIINGTINSTSMLTNFCFKTGIEESGFSDNNAQTVDCINVPLCKCTTCDQITFELGQETSSFNPRPRPWMIGDNNHLYFTQPLIVGPSSIKVLQVKTEVVDFYWYTESPDCKRCNNNNYYWGNIKSGSTNSAGFNISGVPGANDAGVALPNSHEMQFNSTTTTGATFNGNINLQLTVPPQTELQCCNDCFRFCIRYTIVFMENGVCKTCTKVKCYEVKRQHRKSIRKLEPPTNACGDQGAILDPQGDLLQIKKTN